MSTVALNKLLEYLYETLTPSNMLWVGEHLLAQANLQESKAIEPYSMDEIDARIDKAEEDIASGRVTAHEDFMRKRRDGIYS